jgi:DHA2 family multidrug resistance protein
MSILDSTVANIAIPRLQTAFGASLDDVQWVLGGYTLALGVTPNLIANVFVTFILYGGLLLLPLYLQVLRGLSPYEAGLFLLPQALCSMVVVVVGGRLVDKIGTKPVVLPGLLFMALPLWGLLSVTPSTSYGWFQFLLILRGGEIGLVSQPLMRAALVNVPPRRLSQASSRQTAAIRDPVAYGVFRSAL